MENWEYNELIEAVQEVYEELLDEDRGHRYAIARLSEEFDRMGKMEDVIVDTVIGEIAIKNEAVFVGIIAGITRRLSLFNQSDYEGELSTEEMDNLMKRISKVIVGLKNVTIDYNPSAET